MRIDTGDPNCYHPSAMTIKSLAYRCVPKPLINELRHRKHLRDLATAVEPEEAEVRQLVHEGQTVLDIGANFGVFTKLFSQLAGPNGHVLAFEPIPLTFRTLAAGIERYNLKNAKAVNKAVSDKVGMVLMVVPQYDEGPGDNLYQATIVPSAESSKTFSIDATTIDSLQLPRVDFIKIDVEGHELAVLRGARQTLDAYHPTLMVEVSSSATIDYLCKEVGYQQHRTISPSNELFIYS